MKLLPLLLLLWVSASHAEIYRWVDKDGKVHYSDRPDTSVKSEKVVPKSSSTIEMASPTPSPRRSGNTEAEERYQLQIASPAADATIRDNNGQLQVAIAVTPELASFHRLQLLVDGKVLRTLGGGGNFAIDDIQRGEHQLQVKVVDKNGKVLASSPNRTFFMHRHSALFPRPAPPNGGVMPISQ
ncbi:DUF4124 domain-containing protein [Ferrimonas senticii]|uniref:DUF4124 domain-containing protein n=1 Tax=Ferrimonas senticii TaxID=394566 RepID=UPI000411CAD6|nr:DUF4124 domain-containing protein [Ferrimonas senticii]